MPEVVPIIQQSVKNRFPWKLALPLYALSNCFMPLFRKAYFWDDWFVFYSESNDGTKKFFNDGGSWPTRGLLEVDLLNKQPELFNVLTILCFFFAGWCLFHILSTVKVLTTEHVRIITILFLILPINSARVAMINFSYSYSLFFFYLAWYLLVTKRSRFVRYLSIPLFLLSFDTLSLIAFFVVPCAHFLYMKLSVPEPNRRNAYLSSALFAALSPLYWIIERQFNPSQAGWIDYYTLRPIGVLRGLLFLFVCLILILWFLKSRKRGIPENNSYAIIIAGATITAIGAFPYIVGGYLVEISEWMIAFVPRSSDWASRHQLLLGLGFAVAVAGVVGVIGSEFKRHFLAVLFGLCVLLNMTFMHGYYLDSLKQDQLVAAFQRSSELKNSRVIMINDLTDRYNARGRVYQNYEWDGILAKAFGDSSRSSISEMSFVHCNDPLIPDTLLTITARNGRLESTVSRDLGIELSLESIQPCK